MVRGVRADKGRRARRPKRATRSRTTVQRLKDDATYRKHAVPSRLPCSGDIETAAGPVPRRLPVLYADPRRQQIVHCVRNHSPLRSPARSILGPAGTDHIGRWESTGQRQRRRVGAGPSRVEPT